MSTLSVSISSGYEMLRQCRYRALLDALPDEDVLQAEQTAYRVLRLRCLLEQGQIGAACAWGQQAATIAADPSVERQLRLLTAFAALLQEIDGDRWQSTYEAVIAEHELDPETASLASDLNARANVALLTFGRLPLSKRDDVLAQMAQVPQLYEASGQPTDALTAQFRHANYTRNPLYKGLADPRARLTEVAEQAHEPAAALILADARLALAEMDFLDVQTGAQTRGNDELVATFSACIGLYEQGGHAFAQAKVVSSLGKLFLEYGIEAGVAMLRNALPDIEAVAAFSLQQEIWRSLDIWYRHTGDATGLREALQASVHLTQQMGSALTQDVDRQGKADEAFRGGHVKGATTLLAEPRAEPAPGVIDASHMLIEGTSLSSVGQFDKAIEIIKRAIDLLQTQENYFLLAQAWYNLSAIYIDVDYDRALACVDEAIKAASVVNDSLCAAQYRGYRGWLGIQARYKSGATPIMTDPILQDLQAACAELQQIKTLEAMVQLASTCGYLGQAYFIEKNWQPCGFWYTRANEICAAYRLRPGQAFVLMNQALALIEVGRQAGATTYDTADGYLVQAGDLFVQCGYFAMLWRVSFYRGLTQYEPARALAPAQPERAARFQRAEGHFVRASYWIDLLRGYSTAGSETEQQSGWIAYGLDKQLVYDTGMQMNTVFRQDTVAAFQWLERMKGRALLDALADHLTPLPDAAGNEAIREEQSLRAQKLAAQDTGEAIALQQQIDGALERMSRAPATAGYAALRRSDVIDYAALRSLLQSEQAALQDRRLILAQYYCTPQETLLFGMRADWDAPRVERVIVDYAALDTYAGEHFRQPDGVRLMIDLGEAQWLSFSGLIEPLAAWADPDDIIGIIPHGILHDLPLHTLSLKATSGTRTRLAFRNPVFYAPSSSLLGYTLGSRAQTMQPQTKQTAAVFGNSRLDLPRAEEEAQEVAKSLGVTPLLREQVTREALSAALSGCDLAHIAGHSEVHVLDGLGSGVLLAGQDRLTAGDLFSLRTHADLVVLSGCESGVSQQQAGDELMGLVRGLLYAGVGSVLASQWRVYDASTQELFRQFYAHLVGGTPVSKAVALQQAMLAVHAIDDWQSLYYWGSFVLVGNWR
jgi:tetratricopeptide (TPR) repeat protein